MTALLLAACAVLVLCKAIPPSQPQVASPQLAWELDRKGATVRGHSPREGDILRATARGGRHGAVWIYLDGTELVIACPGDAACRQAADAVTAVAPLRRVGTYIVVALSSDAPLVQPRGTFDDDVAAAARAGAESTIDRLIVR